MNPFQKNKIDINSLSPEEQKLFRLYGKIPSKSDHLAKHLKERKYFDSGDYALSKAGKADSVDTGSVGSAHPLPENIPHLSSPVNAGAGSGALGANSVGGGATGSLSTGNNSSGGLPAGSPVKEMSYLNRETSAEEIEKGEQVVDEAAETGELKAKEHPPSPPPVTEGIPIRK